MTRVNFKVNRDDEDNLIIEDKEEGITLIRETFKYENSNKLRYSLLMFAQENGHFSEVYEDISFREWKSFIRMYILDGRRMIIERGSVYGPQTLDYLIESTSTPYAGA